MAARQAWKSASRVRAGLTWYSMELRPFSEAGKLAASQSRASVRKAPKASAPTSGICASSYSLVRRREDRDRRTILGRLELDPDTKADGKRVEIAVHEIGQHRHAFVEGHIADGVGAGR